MSRPYTHVFSGEIESGYPHRGNALTNDEKIDEIAGHFAAIMTTLGLDIEHDSLQRTPQRYAKMLVEELFEGLSPAGFPRVTTQQNSFGYSEPLIETDIAIDSICEHHFVPIIGVCHIAYIPGARLIGLSKLNRIARYFARRPQVQERLTCQVRRALCEILQTEDVAVVVDALHSCVRMRGVQDRDSFTRTADLGGRFRTGEQRRELFAALSAPLKVNL